MWWPERPKFRLVRSFGKRPWAQCSSSPVGTPCLGGYFHTSCKCAVLNVLQPMRISRCRCVHHNVGPYLRRRRCSHGCAPAGCTGDGRHAPLFVRPEYGRARRRPFATGKPATAITAVATSAAAPRGSPERTGGVCAGRCHPIVDHVAARHALIDEISFALTESCVSYFSRCV